ncbi:MAG: hypothetical protein HYW62_04320 [Candidatus Levybacteria bacterium]|nr:hypothetical protein [Candidatus Levybacteria bacterium]
MIIYFLIYFLAGVLQDFLVTLNWRFISKDKILPAVTFSFLATVVSFTVLYNIVTKLDPNKSIAAIVIYSFGVGVGTLLGMKIKHGFKK